MQKYNRYTDNKNRLFVLIERWAKIDVKGKTINYTPSTVTLLNVHAETVQVLTVEEMEAYIATGKLTKIEKPT